MQVVIEPAVTQKLQQLVITLVDEDYFATEEAAIKYVQEIYKFIYSLPTRTHRTMKEKMKVLFVQCSRQTSVLPSIFYLTSKEIST